MATIQRLKLVNYRSFRELDFELRSLNILIGRNGAGKSNLLSFFRFFARSETSRDNISQAGSLKNCMARE
jgi:predicted ATPase